MSEYPLSFPAIMVSQPFDDFYIAAIPASVLLDVAYSDRLVARKQADGSYKVDGSQRARSDERLKEIGKFIDSRSATFPNTIILAANYREADGLVEEEEAIEWTFKLDGAGPTGVLTIPSPAKLAAIMDGQHRLFGFEGTERLKRHLDFSLVCAVYFDLPKPYQAFLFATVNSNQRPVSKSQTYELFGYNIEDESPEKWTPEKLAVFLTRRLNMEKDSPLHNRVLVPAESDFALTRGEIRQRHEWAVSTATVVEGIVRLISNNPKQDAYTIHGDLDYKGRDRSVLSNVPVKSPPPLRELYLSKDDELIYNGLKNYFTAVNRVFWERARDNSLIIRTVGVQALFDIAKAILKRGVESENFTVASFQEQLSPASTVDFSDTFFQTSGTGRGRIRSVIELCLGLIHLDELREKVQKGKMQAGDLAHFERLTR